MANRGSQKRRTAERKARQKERASRTLLVEFARQCGHRRPEAVSDQALRSYVLGKRPRLREAVAQARGGEIELAGMLTAQAQFLRALMGR